MGEEAAVAVEGGGLVKGGTAVGMAGGDSTEGLLMEKCRHRMVSTPRMKAFSQIFSYVVFKLAVHGQYREEAYPKEVHGRKGVVLWWRWSYSYTIIY